MTPESARRLLVIGATGRTGRHVVLQALEQGHTVTAFARGSADRLTAHPRLSYVSGALPQDAAALAEAMAGQDAVISTIGRGQSLRSMELIQRSVPPLLAAMQQQAVRRLIFTSAIGVGDTFAGVPVFSKLVIRVFLHHLYADKIAGEAGIQESDLDWTLVQPAQLTDGALTRQYRAGEHLALRGRPTISRADVAHFLIRQVGDPAFVRKVVLQAY